MKSKNATLHVVVDSKQAILAVYEAPIAGKNKAYTEARPLKGHRVLQVSVPFVFKKIKSFEEAAEVVKPHLASATLLRKG